MTRSRRRTVLLAAAGVSAMLIAVGVPWALSGNSDKPGGQTTQGGAGIELVGKSTTPKINPATAGRLADAEKAFSVALLHQLAGDGKSNVSVSPASLALALAMLQNGASGSTRDQIQTALRSRGLSSLAQNSGWQALTAAWSSAAKDGAFVLSSANSAWLQKGFRVKTAFLDAIKSYYGAGVWTVDYAKHMSAALHAINAWTKQETNGKITKLFDSLDPLTVLVLADAVYFKAAWATPFDPHSTHPGSFRLASGKIVKPPFMSDDEGEHSVAVTPDYEAVELPYRGGRFAALAVMPRTSSLRDFTASLTTTTLDGIVSSLQTQPVDLSMPKFTTRSNLDLESALSALGMPEAFTANADFSPMTSQPVQIAKVIQRVYLAVGEKGTEAAAATGVDIKATSARAPVTPVALDHPFLFLIRDTVTGAILFASQVADPTAS